MLNDHLDQIKEVKNASNEKKKENFIRLIKGYTANAAYEDMKTVMRKSKFNDLKIYLNLLI